VIDNANEIHAEDFCQHFGYIQVVRRYSFQRVSHRNLRPTRANGTGESTPISMLACVCLSRAAAPG